MMDFMSLPELDLSFSYFPQMVTSWMYTIRGKKLKKIKQAENAYVILTHRES